MTYASVTLLRREELRFLIRIEERPAAKDAQHEKMKSMCRNLGEETIRNVFRTGYCAATKDFKNLSFSFVKNVITEVMQRETLCATLNQSFNPYSRIDTTMQVLVDKIVSNSGLITYNAVFFRERVINAGEKEVNQKLQVTRRFLYRQTIPYQSPSEPKRTSPNLDALVASATIIKIKNTGIARQICMKSTDKPASHSHSPMQTVVWRPVCLSRQARAHALA